MTIIFDDARGQELTAAINNTPTPSRLVDLLSVSQYRSIWTVWQGFLEWNWFTGGYVVFGAAVIVASYKSAWTGRDVTAHGWALAWAVAVVLAFGLLGAVLDLVGIILSAVFGHGSPDLIRGIKYPVVGIVVAAIYLGVCHLVVRASALVTGFLKPR